MSDIPQTKAVWGFMDKAPKDRRLLLMWNLSHVVGTGRWSEDLGGWVNESGFIGNAVRWTYIPLPPGQEDG